MQIHFAVPMTAGLIAPARRSGRRWPGWERRDIYRSPPHFPTMACRIDRPDDSSPRQVITAGRRSSAILYIQRRRQAADQPHRGPCPSHSEARVIEQMASPMPMCAPESSVHRARAVLADGVPGFF